jgi:hypothetical protein
MARSSHRKTKRGGSSYSSAASYGEYVNGNQNAQFDRVFSTSGPYGNINSNTIIGAQGQNAVQPNMPSSQDLSLIQTAGKRGKRGGVWGQVINQAVVPVALLGMQQTYRKKHGGKKSRKNGKKTRRNRGKKTRRH